MFARFDIEWLVPVVAMMIYALSAVLKAKEQAQPKAQPTTRRNPGQELDRFLQEIDRLRRQQEARSTGAQSQAAEMDQHPAKPVVLVRPAALLPMPPVNQPPVIRPQPVIVNQGARDPEPPLRSFRAPTPTLAPLDFIPRTTRPNPTRAAIALLTSRQTVATAFLLNEILGPPKCNKRRH